MGSVLILLVLPHPHQFGVPYICLAIINYPVYTPRISKNRNLKKRPETNGY